MPPSMIQVLTGHEPRRLAVGEEDAGRGDVSGSAHGFATGRIAVYQTLLARPDAAGRVDLPLTRNHLMWGAAAESASVGS